MARQRKAIMFILDGIGDRPIKRLGSLTPLEYAKTPTLDMLATQGICGLMDPLSPGIRVGTDVGHLALFGYNPLKVYWGRGPIEAAGVGVELEPGDVALRCNFATVDEQGLLVDRRAGRIRQGTSELAKTLNGIDLGDSCEVVFREATEHRAVLILRGDNLSAELTNSDPGPTHEGEPLQEVVPKGMDLPFAQRTAKLVNTFIGKSLEILRDHPVNRGREASGLPPANVVITRGAGMKVRMRSLAERFHIHGTCVAAESTVIGIARITGFATLTSPLLTANTDTDLMEKMRLAKAGLETSDLVIVHVKATDLLGHDNKPEEKAAFIERFDECVAWLRGELSSPEEIYFVLAGDHSTPCELGEHSADPVPVFICGGDVLTDEVTVYGERACARGGLCRINANELLLSVLDLVGVTYRFGA